MIYLDYNATTPLCEPARAAMLPYLTEHFGNPSSVHSAGREARAAIDDARDALATMLRAKPHELIFTGSGTEANNLAVLGLARSQAARGRHLICSTTEHHAVLHAFEQLEKERFEVTWLRVDNCGRVDPQELADQLRDDTTLVSVMTANNETGVLQPMHKISAVCRARGVLLHSDMVQSFAKVVIPSEVVESPCSGEQANPARRCLDSARHDRIGELVDAASFAAHKFYGPKGAGFLYVRSGIPIAPISFGGSHENQRRAGTENVAAIAGMSAAAAWALRDAETEQQREADLRDRLWQRIQASGWDVQLNSPTADVLGNTLNVSFVGISSETMLMALDLEGLCASSGSACMVGSVVPSHVLLAMGFPAERASSAIRFSLGKQTTADEVDAAGEVIERALSRMGGRRSRGAVSPASANGSAGASPSLTEHARMR